MSYRNDSDWELKKRDAQVHMAYYDKQSAEHRRLEWGDDYYAAENLRRKRCRSSTSLPNVNVKDMAK